MASPLTLEDFSLPPTQVATDWDEEGKTLTEEARLSAYEDGYKAGWDDATTAESEARTRISADFEKSLADLSFPYHEAQDHVLNQVAPLLRMMADKVLPDIARSGFADVVVEIVFRAAKDAAGAPVELVVSPANSAALEVLLEGDSALPVQIVEEPSLGPGQVFIRGAKGEQMIDIDKVLNEIQEAVDGFLAREEQEEAQGHG